MSAGLLLNTSAAAVVYGQSAAKAAPLPTVSAQKISLNKYLDYFYNRYTHHLDKYGLVFKAPGYGISRFKKAETPREKLSLAVYYKYRAQRGDKRARQIIRKNCKKAYQIWRHKKDKSFSFSDGWGMMVLISLNEQLPLLFKKDEKNKFYRLIKQKIKTVILAPDTENRAALGAIYAQITIDKLEQKKLIGADEYKGLNKLIYLKIKKVLDKNISADGWYREGKPLRFNPHYQMITAIAMAAYGQHTKNIEFTAAAKKMWSNLYELSFGNGMVEARLGPRPVGLGAQFYLGMGWLSYTFAAPDYDVYLNYAYGNRFFSDAKHPDRLEYHSTVKNSYADYHDDISFSNLAELLRQFPKFNQIKINLNHKQLKRSRQKIIFNGLEYKQSDADHTIILKKNPWGFKDEKQKAVIAQTYGQPRLNQNEENNKVKRFLRKLKTIMGRAPHLSTQSLNILAAAYIYGGYNLNEIINTIQHGPRAVHPSIPAKLWRQTKVYLKYKQSTLNVAGINIL